MPPVASGGPPLTRPLPRGATVKRMSSVSPVAVYADLEPSSEARAAGLTLALIAAGLFALSIVSPGVLGDGDTFMHVAAGDWILAHGAVPRADPFSHSMPGAPWTAHEWLSEVLLALAFRCGSWSGVALMTGAAAGGAALVMGLKVSRALRGVMLAVVVLLGLGLWAPSLLARPHILALPVAALWTAGLIEAADRAKAPPLVLAGLMVLWSNMHGGFIFGLFLIGPFALEAVLEVPATARRGAIRDWGVFGLAAVLAALVNPYGVEALFFPFRLMQIKNLSQISEWSPQDFGQVGPLEIALIALIAFALRRPIVVAPIRAALVVVLLAMALAHARHGLLLGLIAPMVLAGPVAEATGAAPALGEARGRARVALVATLAAGLALGLMRLAEPIVRVDARAAPMSALAVVPSELRLKPVLNDYGFGGYLIGSGVRPFIDGRADMYGGDMLGLYRRLVAGDPSTVENTLRRYGIVWTLFAPDAGIVAVLDREPGWRRLYADGFAVVHVRVAPTPDAGQLGSE
jgi:hypothetical protein